MGKDRLTDPQARQFLLEIHDFLELDQEPAVNLGEVENLFDAETGAEGVADEENAFGVGHAEFAADDFARQDVAVAIDFGANAPGFAVAAQAAAADFQGAQAFLQAFLERAADGHGFAHAFHHRGERGVGLREFFEGEPGDFGDDVINAGLKAGGGFARDVVSELVQEIADGELGGDFGDGKAGGLGGEGGAAAHARVHFNDHHAAGVRADAKLDVGAAGFHADRPDHGEALVAHELVFLVVLLYIKNKRSKHFQLLNTVYSKVKFKLH